MPLRRGRTGASSTSWTGSVPSSMSFIGCGACGSVAALVDQAIGLDPRHHRTHPLAHLLDLVVRSETPPPLQCGRAGAVLEDEALRVLAGLALGELMAHRLLGAVVDDVRAGSI